MNNIKMTDKALVEEFLDTLKLYSRIAEMEKENPFGLMREIYVNLLGEDQVVVDRVGTNFMTNQPVYNLRIVGMKQSELYREVKEAVMADLSSNLY